MSAPPSSSTSDHAGPQAASAPGAGRIVVCPTCGGDSLYAPSNPWRPFCSERCKKIDLGAWASEGYRVQAGPDAANPEDLPD